ncbi:WD domain, G-beta repeat protein [Dictyocaulus viviparus]|uniref:WD domain, G-beta repeat protein n=1 Tax=Dictyocaulus viviparus TaxID=29172 RepID=A0A0D8Y761_DICVI|nr:WD domain, G-beta repeat protein [Dictyocaulus viviparus]
MGGWISALLFKPRSLSIESTDRDPSELLSTAAEIAALHRMENAISGIGATQMNDDETLRSLDNIDTGTFADFLDDDESDSSDSDESCPRMSIHRQGDMFEKQRKITFQGRMTISDQQVYRELCEETEYHGFYSKCLSVAKLCSRREVLKPRGGSSLCPGIKTVLVNQFLPNCRRIVDKLKSKSFCCQFVKGGKELMVASQDERIRFFQQCGPRDRYSLKSTIHVPVTSWSILDVVMNSTGNALCYGTWKDSVFYARLLDPTSDNLTGVSWTELEIPNQHTTMAVFSLRFSQQGHEILCGGSDRGLHIFDLESMNRVVTVNDAHGDDVNAVCYGDTNSYLLYSGGDDGLVKVFDRRALGELDYQPVGVFAGHRDGITYIDSRGDDRHLISNSKDQSIKLWDLRRFSSYKTVRKTINCVRQQSWDYRWQPPPPTGNSLLKGDTSVVTLRGHSVLHTLVRAKFSPNRTGRRYVYTGCARGEVVIYDLLASSPSAVSTSDSTPNPVICRLPGHMGVVRDADWHPTNNEIVTSAWDGVTSVWKWDERHGHITSIELNQTNSEDSCDESYKPILKRQKTAQRMKLIRRWQAAHSVEESAASHHELLYTF